MCVPAEEIKGIATRISHMPKFFEGKFVRLCVTIFAENVLEVYWHKPVIQRIIFAYQLTPSSATNFIELKEKRAFSHLPSVS